MLTERYRPHHHRGQDCRVTCCRNLLDFYGRRYSYGDIQGLGSSFFFTYRTQWAERDRLLMADGGIPPLFWPVSGQRMDVLETIAYVFNATLVSAESQSSDDAHAAIERYVANGVPVMVAVSRDVVHRHLGVTPEFPDYLGDLTFGGHWMVVTGLDPVARIATVYETDIAEPLRLPYEVLREARTHGDDQPNCFMKSRNRWAALIPPAQMPPLPHMMRTALMRTAQLMRHPVGDGVDDMGLRGLARFAAEFPRWYEDGRATPAHLRATLHMMWLNSERLSGGSFGRKNFGMFLRRAAGALQKPALGEAATHYAQAAQDWNGLLGEIAPVLESGGPASFDNDRVRGLLDGILRAECAGIERIEEALA